LAKDGLSSITVTEKPALEPNSTKGLAICPPPKITKLGSGK
jgi:hypothetical protein